MKYFAGLVCCIFCMAAKSSDTIYTEDFRDPRYLRYLDSMQAYEMGYSVAKNIADTLKGIMGDNSLAPYFLSRYSSNGDARSDGYFYNYNENADVEIGHVNDSFRGIKSDAKVPWQYVETQYKRLDALKIKPVGVVQGAELPYVYVYAKPATTVVYKKVKRYTVIDPAIKFLKRDDGKTKIAYILKYYYIQEGHNHERIDSIEKLDPMTHKHLSF